MSTEADLIWWYTGESPPDPVNLTATDPYARDLDREWLLDIDLGGEVLRYATREVLVQRSTESTEMLLYRPGLRRVSVRIGETLSQVGVAITDPAKPWMQHIARGGTIDTRTAELRLLIGPQVLEDARLVLRGSFTGATFADSRSPDSLQGTVSAQRLDINAQVPGPQAVVDDSTFISIANTELYDTVFEGLPYPIVVGYPGTGDADQTNPQGVTDAMLVKFNGLVGPGESRLMISDDEVDATTVHIWNVETSEGEGTQPPGTITNYPRHSDCTVGVGTDLLGRTYSYAEFPSFTDSTAIPAWGDTYAVGWRNNGSYGGGILNEQRTGPLRGLGEVVLWLWQRGGVKVDYARMQSEMADLNRFKLDGQLGGGSMGQLDPMGFVQDELATLFPILVIYGERGWYVRRRKDRPTARDARAHLSTELQEIARRGAVRQMSGTSNYFLLEYGVRKMSGFASKRRILSPEYGEGYQVGSGVDSRVISSWVCRRSLDIYGRRLEHAPLRCEFLWSDSTAALILASMADRYALPRDVVAYAGPGLEWVEPGDVLTITDPDLSYNERPALVEENVVGGSLCELRLVMAYPETVSTS